MAEPIFSRDLRMSGTSTRSLERAARDDRVLRLRPGVYADAAEWDALGARERHLLQAVAVSRVFRRAPVFSHHSAAAVWGIPIIGGWPPTVTISVESEHGTSRRAGVRAVVARFGEGDVVERMGMRVTSLARTAVDLARTADLPQAVTALDYAIASGALNRDDLLEWMSSRRPFPGVRKLQVAVAAAFGRSESPLESLSMARFAAWGWPLPVQQYPIRGASGALYRVDFWWPEVGLVGEADGRGKYSAPDALWEEKRREDAIRAVVPRFARWGWDDALAGEPLANLLLRQGFPRPRNAVRAGLRH